VDRARIVPEQQRRGGVEVLAQRLRTALLEPSHEAQVVLGQRRQGPVARHVQQEQVLARELDLAQSRAGRQRPLEDRLAQAGRDLGRRPSSRSRGGAGGDPSARSVGPSGGRAGGDPSARRACARLLPRRAEHDEHRPRA
jgi:hypothetical protein